MLKAACALLALASLGMAENATPKDSVRVEQGALHGMLNGNKTVAMFRGVPFAAPPVGDLRWRPPQPPQAWKGIRDAGRFGARCMQTLIYPDIKFRDAGDSEDCLFLNIWTPLKRTGEKLPVLVWLYGGGFVAGAASEPRYDGENLAKKGVIVIEPNYRLGVFGFLAHPELTKESPHHASGNYGLLDQVAALEWVKRNIAAFGGDPNQVTINGESAGSFSVSALMASPLSSGLFQRAMGESGAFFATTLETADLVDSEKAGSSFAESIGAKNLAALRKMPAEELLQAAAKAHGVRFGPSIDGYLLTQPVAQTFAEGKQAKVPLLAGWNADEGKINVLLNPNKPTARSFAEQARARFGNAAPEFLKAYPAENDAQAVASAEALAGDDFIAYSTWKWLNEQVETGAAPVFAYVFAQTPPSKPDPKIGGLPLSAFGARHSGEIEYVFETLEWRDAPWTEQDFKLSNDIATYWTNFIKKGNPNGDDLPKWPQYSSSDGYAVMTLAAGETKAAPEQHRARYEFLEKHASAEKP
jgi:para-nitrobenzyl esterase